MNIFMDVISQTENFKLDFKKSKKTSEKIYYIKTDKKNNEIKIFIIHLLGDAFFYLPKWE